MNDSISGNMDLNRIGYRTSADRTHLGYWQLIVTVCTDAEMLAGHQKQVPDVGETDAAFGGVVGGVIGRDCVHKGHARGDSCVDERWIGSSNVLPTTTNEAEMFFEVLVRHVGADAYAHESKRAVEELQKSSFGPYRCHYLGAGKGGENEGVVLMEG